MEKFTMNYLTILFIFLVLNEAAYADATKHQEFLAFSTMETALPEELDNERGMGGVVSNTILSRMNVAASLSDNVTYNTISGFNIIDNGAFSSASGFNTVIQNSGNSVLIQDTTIINVMINDLPPLN